MGQSCIKNYVMIRRLNNWTRWCDQTVKSEELHEVFHNAWLIVCFFRRDDHKGNDICKAQHVIIVNNKMICELLEQYVENVPKCVNNLSFTCTEKSSYGPLVRLVLLSQYTGGKVIYWQKLCGLHYHRGRCALFHLVSVGPWTVELLRHTPFLIFLPSL